MIDKVSLSNAALSLISNSQKSQFNSGPTSFKDLIKGYLQDVNNQQKVADKMINNFLTGQADVHQVMIALEKADLSFELMMQIRNKLLDAYQEIMRMQV